ncbi:hypothetical protein GW17_00011498 [Ensete ventricosum]|nr:hypothetical protein GW17_00011498 [Ensete ventricosum]RZS12208.1 hypothetical protein BHM03_00043620 [Ensete ventricosum]
MEVEVQEKLYPTPLHSHEAVVRDRVVFTESLRRFHSSMSTKFMYAAPSQAFSFPPTTTSASFVLRRYYLSLLHHYEQVYYFRIQGPLVPPAGEMLLILICDTGEMDHAPWCSQLLPKPGQLPASLTTASSSPTPPCRPQKLGKERLLSH